MRYKDKVSHLLGIIENKTISLKNSVENGSLSKDDATRVLDTLLKDIEYTQSLIDLEDRDMPL